MTFVGKAITLTPTQGAYQKTVTGRVVHETATQITVEAEGFRSKKFRKSDWLPVSIIDQDFPCYKAVIKD